MEFSSYLPQKFFGPPSTRTLSNQELKYHSLCSIHINSVQLILIRQVTAPAFTFTAS